MATPLQNLGNKIKSRYLDVRSSVGNFIDSNKEKNRALSTTQQTQKASTGSSFNPYGPTTPLPQPIKGKAVVEYPSASPAAVSPVQPKITSPAGKSYVDTLSSSNNQAVFDSTLKNLQQPQIASNTQNKSIPEVPNPTNTPKTPISTGNNSNSEQSAYLKYLTGIFDPKNVESARKKQEDAAKRLADIQTKGEQASTEARRNYEKILDTPGGLKSGAQESATASRRRSNQELADLALQESAAARSAGVYQDTLKNMLTAGASLYGAEQAAKKSLQDSSFSLSSGEERYQLNPETGAYEKVASGLPKPGTNNSDEILSVTEAQALGVPYGTTKGQAYGSSVTGKPTAEQSKARQFAVSASNANNTLNTLGYDIGAIEVGLPNFAKSSQRQQFEQAARAFINSVLRRESGATITDDEFKNKYKELIDQPGDRTEVKEQKKLARAAAVSSIQEAGGEMVGSSSGGTFAEEW